MDINHIRCELYRFFPEYNLRYGENFNMTFKIMCLMFNRGKIDRNYFFVLEYNYFDNILYFCFKVIL